MSRRILQHGLFWMLFIMIYVVVKLLFASPSDLAYPPVRRFFRFFFSELVFLPWKAIPFYFLFYYLLPKYLQKGEYLKIGLFFLSSLVLCLYGYRSMVSPVSNAMYGEIPTFKVYSFKRLLFSLTDIIPAVGLASTVKLLRGRIAAQHKVKALQKEKRAAELNFLKAQTNPHFLFNTLNNLYGLARRNAGNTASFILKLSNIMRYILQECQSSTIPIEKEVKIIEDYIELEKLRYDERLKVSFQQDIDDGEQEIAPLILLPFVENAFKHGASETRFDTFIDIDLRLANRQLAFSIKNTRAAEEDKIEKGIGLQNVKRQLDLIYEDGYSLQINAEQNYFSVKLFVHLK